ncbi:MAG: S-layer homology domain-containing protein, partial [Clostridia bacterium]|nr:S-layer homology domain-containing protein [Clostridia bacterium]
PVSFTDVKNAHWFYKAVSYVVDKNLMVGMGEGIFNPNAKFTRAMTVQVLSQLSGDDLKGYTTTYFPDVPDGSWFENEVAWAVDKEIVVGMDGKFNPNANVTREQLARMIHQFAVKYNITNKFPAGPLSVYSFDDGEKVGSWAVEDVEWAIYNGVITGVGNDMLDPRGTATRAQAAQLFYTLHFMKTDSVLPIDTKDFDAIVTKESDAIQIFCWGDSMTAGGYPEELRDYAFAQGYGTRDFKVYNYGAGGDTAEHVAMKQGAMPMYVAPFKIPADKTAVRIYLYDEDYKLVESLADLGTKGLSPVTIAGQKGQISYKEVDGEECYYFARQGTGTFEEVNVDRLTRVVTNGMVMPDKDDFHVIFSGPSNGYNKDDAHKLIATQQRMIDYIGTDNYIIISLTCLEYLPGLPEFNADLADYYGEHFLDFRTYALTEGMDDAIEQGLLTAPTEQDLLDIARGEIPESMRSDVEHGNHVYNTLLGQQVYKKLVELGYIEATK